jgi:hypothetical protein
LHGQVRELLTDYGHIDSLFFDFTYHHAMVGKNDFGQPSTAKITRVGQHKLVKTIRELQLTSCK